MDQRLSVHSWMLSFSLFLTWRHRVILATHIPVPVCRPVSILYYDVPLSSSRVFHRLRSVAP